MKKYIITFKKPITREIDFVEIYANDIYQAEGKFIKLHKGKFIRILTIIKQEEK